MNKFEFGAILKTLREGVGFSASEFDKKLGWVNQKHKRIENGVGNLKMSVCLEYLSVIGYELYVNEMLIRTVDEVMLEFSRCIHEKKISVDHLLSLGMTISSAMFIQKNAELMTISAFLDFQKFLKCDIRLVSTHEGLSLGFRMNCNAATPPPILKEYVDRKKIGEWLLEMRNEVLVKDFSIKLGWSGDTYRRFESGSRNYRVRGLCQYLEVVRGCLSIDGIVFSAPHDIVRYLKNKRGAMSLSEMAQRSGISRVTLASIETEKSDLSIDFLLAYCRVLDIKIEIRPKETVTLVGGNGTNINE